MQSTLSSLFGFPAGIIGGYLWEAFSPQTPYYLSGIAGFISAILFWLGVQEPPKYEEEENISKTQD